MLFSLTPPQKIARHGREFKLPIMENTISRKIDVDFQLNIQIG